MAHVSTAYAVPPCSTVMYIIYSRDAALVISSDHCAQSAFLLLGRSIVTRF